MKYTLIKTLGACASTFLASQVGAQIISEDFSSPMTIQNNGATSELGNGGSYAFGSWVYNAGNMGINDPAEGDGLGNSLGNAISSIGIARAQDVRGTNARAVSVIFDGSSFSNGQEYTVSFDVIGDADGANNGRYWFAEVSGDGPDDGILIDGTHGGWASAKPFAVSGTGGNATVSFLEDSPGNGVSLESANVAGVTNESFNFTYSADTDLAFAAGTFNNAFGIDNFQIAAIPEPSSFALLAGLGSLGLIMLRRRR